MSDTTKQPYAEWLENVLSQIVGTDIDGIAVIAMDKQGDITPYYFHCGAKTLMYMHAHIMAEATLLMCQDNAKSIIEAAEDDEEG